MLVTVDQIKAKINELPADYAEHVHCGKPGMAEVESFSDPKQEKPWVVHIEKAKTVRYRSVTCTCPATKLCKHITAFYAVAKGIKPQGVTDPLKTTTPREEGGNKTTSKEIEAKENVKKQRVEIYDQISAAFAKLAELEDDGEIEK